MSNNAELQALALTLAYEFALPVIESNCPHRVDSGDELEWQWFELPQQGNEDVDSAINDCARFLDMRELLERHSEHKDWVRVHDESEAAR